MAREALPHVWIASFSCRSLSSARISPARNLNGTELDGVDMLASVSSSLSILADLRLVDRDMCGELHVGLRMESIEIERR